jgi:hypothetical protein
MLSLRDAVEQKTMPIRMQRDPTKKQARHRLEGLARRRTREEAPRNISDQMIKSFVSRMREYAAANDLGKPTLMFAQTDNVFGVALDWRDYRRAFTFNKGSWTIADYQRLCDALRAW